jgi:Mannosyltransferase (PIG-V)
MPGDMARDRIEALAAFALSRAVVVAAGFGALAAWGVHARNEAAFDGGGLTDGAGPLARWDSVWFLEIARDGYDEAPDAAFFPLYPLLLKLTGSSVAGGVVVSLACFGAALWLLHRLVGVDFGGDAARLCVLLVAVFPGALFFSAVYSESLFLLLSVAAVYGARTGRWELAGVAGLLAAATRSAGVLLLVPLAILWWRAGRPRRGAVWIAAVPLGLVAFCAWLQVERGDWWLVFDAQEAWDRSLAVPFADPARAAWEGASEIVRGEPRTWPVFDTAWFDVGLFALLLGALVALGGAVRRLPPAYWGYAAAALALPLLLPADGQPLMSLPRFLAVLWPLHLWLALVLVERPRWRRAVVGVFVGGLAVASAEFATWGWVA